MNNSNDYDRVLYFMMRIYVCVDEWYVRALKTVPVILTNNETIQLGTNVGSMN